MKVFRKIIIVILAIVALFLSALVGYTSKYYEAINIEDYFSNDTDNVNIEYKDKNIWLTPIENEQKEAFVFYPGGLVEKEAYIPIMYNLASEGYVSVIIDMPFKLAVFNINGANTVFDSDYKNKDWYLGGHSMGGAFGAKYYKDNNDKIKGLVLMAAYSTFDLKFENSNVLLMYGSEDGVLNMSKYEKCKSNLNFRKDMEYVISGGNHSGFGSYGQQRSDNTPQITQSEQWKIASDKIIGFMTK